MMWIVEKEGRKGKTEPWSWLRSDGNLVGEEEEHGNCGIEKCWPRQKVKKGEGGQNEAGAGGAVGAVEKSKERTKTKALSIFLNSDPVRERRDTGNATRTIG